MNELENYLSNERLLVQSFANILAQVKAKGHAYNYRWHDNCNCIIVDCSACGIQLHLIMGADHVDLAYSNPRTNLLKVPCLALAELYL